MPEPPERLFRDDAGAALERAAHLEHENQQLRAEIARMREPGNPRPGRDATTVRTNRFPLRYAALGSMTAMVVIGAAMMVFASRPAPPHPVVMQRPLVLPSPQITPAPTLAVAPAPVEEDDCTTPYTYDDQRVKHYKLQCIHPERRPR